MWNDEILEFSFLNCWQVINRKAIDTDIEDVIILDLSNELMKIKNEILSTGGSMEEAYNLFHIIFLSSWDEKVVLSIVAEGGSICKRV